MRTNADWIATPHPDGTTTYTPPPRETPMTDDTRVWPEPGDDEPDAYAIVRPTDPPFPGDGAAKCSLGAINRRLRRGEATAEDGQRAVQIAQAWRDRGMPAPWQHYADAVACAANGAVQMGDSYEAFLRRRLAQPPTAGFTVPSGALHPSLFPFQRHAVDLALERGRAALFEDTGLGKSRQILEWMAQVATHTRSRCLLITPLAVAHQFVRDEAPALGLELAYCRSQAEADASGAALVVTNYDRAQAFEGASWAGVALDEADIIANYVGATNRRLTAMFRETPYRLVATATPSPNDLIELGRYSEFLGVMESGEMLTRYFIRDSQQAATLRLRRWAAAGPFWDWLVSWAICAGLPSDLGDYDDTAYVLPPLSIEQHAVTVDYADAQAHGQLFPSANQSATQIWKVKRETHADRCALTADLVAQKPDRPWVVWCSTDEESRLLARLIPDAVEVRGGHTPDQKEDRLRAFSEGRARVIVTKPKIAGAGLNWQHCADMVYCSPTFSFRHFYQGLRRIYRFRQARPVTCYVVIAETEENVVAAIARKQATHRELHAQARAAMRRQRALGTDWRIAEGDSQPLIVPDWLKTAA